MTSIPAAAPRATTTAEHSPGVLPITLDALGVPLSGLLAHPTDGPPRATVVALHGGGMRAGYFDGQAHPTLSLLTVAAHLGFAVLALDRPGYGTSAAHLPAGETLAEQATRVLAALDTYERTRITGAGFLLLGHSYGGKLALRTAAQARPGTVLAVDVSGCGAEYAVPHDQLPDRDHAGSLRHNWGPLRLYPDGSFASLAPLVAARPVRECAEARDWPLRFPEVAARIDMPVRMTFAEFEYWWRHDDAARARMERAFPDKVLRFTRHSGAGHNISLGWAARSYHLGALGFFEECLAAHHSAPRSSRARTAQAPA
ncbi:alpha/beta hydrolase family protein [Streptomyces sp. NPDC058326]|uniref:alpha/beta hydrolase family protein n=1 Tax=Streptomyces sp. NPDC058326 TaxID=3346447 RepID=UPI0036E659F8